MIHITANKIQAISKITPDEAVTSIKYNNFKVIKVININENGGVIVKINSANEPRTTYLAMWFSVIDTIIQPTAKKIAAK
jgi:hypothetical protein